MYRNFAAVTICVTASLAILADGEKHAAQAAQLEQPDGPAHRAEEEAETNAGFIAADSPPEDYGGGSYRAEFDSGYGRPMTRVLGSGGSVRAALAREGTGGVAQMTAPTGYGVGGITDEQLAQMSDAERAALEELLRGDGPPGSAADRRNQASNLRQASLARSGAANSDDF